MVYLLFNRRSFVSTLATLLVTIGWFCWGTLVWVPMAIAQESLPQESAHHGVAVHLFEWKWTDIAQECEQFLAPNGYEAVQVSPPNEHAVIDEYPWYERYQPVSYKLESRSGTRAEFADMVNRCKAVGVDIYVDAVINHMSAVGEGEGIARSLFHPYDYPGLYESDDFHHCGRHGDNDIENYGDRWEVQTCELVGLADLDTHSAQVQHKIADYLNDLVDLGVAGFRLDASKHISADDIRDILQQIKGHPYIYQEVIDQGGEPIQASEYFKNGDVTEFKYSVKLSQTFFQGKLAWLKNFGEAWELMPSDKAMVFVDNHDNQRGHGGGGHIVTYKEGILYDLANVFMLAWPYGHPRVMSSYAFATESQGPPSNLTGHTDDIYGANGQPNCFDEWKCEHRWRPIANMVAFHNVTAGHNTVSDWWSNGNNQIAFGREDKGFVVINRERKPLQREFQTSMSQGSYCNVIDGSLNKKENLCTGSTILVDDQGRAKISVPFRNAVAIHVGAKLL